jgi:DNA-binding Xre family transcriptional regulator
MVIDVKALKIAMARACLGVADLGKAADVGRATIVRILRGDGENVRGKTVGKLAKALHVDVLDLIANEGNRPGCGQ